MATAMDGNDVLNDSRYVTASAGAYRRELALVRFHVAAPSELRSRLAPPCFSTPRFTFRSG